MKVKIVIQTMELTPEGEIGRRDSEVWNGELDILPEGEYLTKISFLSEGIEHPICDVPFSPNVGYWSWHSGEWSNPDMEQREAIIMREQDKND